jgi:hypothetical protein
MIFVLVPTLVGLIAGIAWIWRFKAIPVWARLSAIVPVGFAAWCVFRGFTYLALAFQVSEDLPVGERAKQLAMNISCVLSYGMRFAVAALVSTFWLLFIRSRWKARSAAGDDSTEKSNR